MKTLFTISLLFLSLFAQADSWTQKADFGGGTRQDAFAFSIGTKGYVGAGDGHNDFWEYDPFVDSWTQKADYAGGFTYGGIGFTILNKGYAGLGNNKFFYEYDPSTNIWTAKANYPASNTAFAVSFTVNNLGYVCTGAYGGQSDSLWQYNPGLDVWTKKNNLPGVARDGAIGFSIGTKGYVGTGFNYPSSFLNDFWEYDPSTDTWTQKANAPDSARVVAVGFSICNKGYVTLGEEQNANDLWEYDPAINQWTPKANFPGPSRGEAAYFVIGYKAYIGTGTPNGSPPDFKDFYEYTPDSIECTTGINELSSSSFQFQVSPNPAKDVIVCSFAFSANKKVEISIFDATGRLTPYPVTTPYPLKGESAQSPTLGSGGYIIDVRDFSEGIYFIVATDGEEKAVSKFVKE